MDALLGVHGDDEEDDTGAHGDHGVTQRLQGLSAGDFKAAQHGTERPQQCRNHEHDQNCPFAAGKRTEMLDFAVDPILASGQFAGLVAEEHVHEQQIGRDDQNRHRRKRDLEPVKEAYGRAICLFHEASQNAVGRRTDQGVDTTQRGAVGHAQKQAHTEVAFRLIDGLVDARGANDGHKCKSDRKHHGGGSGV